MLPCAVRFCSILLGCDRVFADKSGVALGPDISSGRWWSTSGRAGPDMASRVAQASVLIVLAALVLCLLPTTAGAADERRDRARLRSHQDGQPQHRPGVRGP